MNQEQERSELPLSVIIPVYNGQNHLLHCLNSLRVQSFSHFEAIVVDDGSTDESLRIATKICQQDRRFTVISTPNRGVSQARNTGLKTARGTYVTFVDADDWVEPSMYEDLMRPTDRHQYDAVAGDLILESARGSTRVEQARSASGEYDVDRINREILPILVSSDNLTRDWPYRIVTKLFRRDHLLEHNLWFVPGLRAAQDFVFSVAAMVKTESFYYAKGSSGYHYRWNPNSRTRSRLPAAWTNYRTVDNALREAVANSSQFATQLALAELHGDLSALTYLYKNCHASESQVLYQDLTTNLSAVDRKSAFQALNWSTLPTGKRMICMLMRRRRYRTIHALLLSRGSAQRLQSRLLPSRLG